MDNCGRALERSGEVALLTDKSIVISVSSGADRHHNGMDIIATQLAVLAIDRLTQWALCLAPSCHGHPNYHLHSASLLMTVS